MREWLGSLLTASSLLVTVPLLELSLLATDPSITTIDVARVAVPVLGSALAFSASIVFILETYERKTKRNTFALAQKSLDGFISKQAVHSAAKPNEAQSKSEEFGAEAYSAYYDATRLSRFGRLSFLIGVGFLIGSLVVMVFELLP